MGDNAYWPKDKLRDQLFTHGITITTQTRSNWTFTNSPEDIEMLKNHRGQVERRIGSFDQQFYAGRTLCHSERHYRTSRLTKVPDHNISRHLGVGRNLPEKQLLYFRIAS